jgi:hypothetical protein
MNTLLLGGQDVPIQDMIAQASCYDVCFNCNGLGRAGSGSSYIATFSNVACGPHDHVLLGGQDMPIPDMRDK